VKRSSRHLSFVTVATDAAQCKEDRFARSHRSASVAMPHFSRKKMASFCILRPAYKMSDPKFVRTLLVFLFVLPLMSAVAKVPAQTSLSNLQSVDSPGSDLFLRSGSTGMVLVVVRDNQIFFRGYGETAPKLPSDASSGLSVKALLTHKDLHHRRPHQTS
jgi:hypothetical protein